MNIVTIYGSERKGSTNNIVQLILKRLQTDNGSLTEFFLPRDMPHFCAGCSNCFSKGEEYCPHAQSITPIRDAMINADLIIFSSPVYVLRASGQMKALLFNVFRIVHKRFETNPTDKQYWIRYGWLADERPWR